MSQPENLLRKRGAIKAKLTNFGKYVSMLSEKDNLTSEELESLSQRLDRANSLLGEFDEIQMQIELIATELEAEYEIRGDFENLFYKEIAQANVIFKKYVKVTDANAPVNQAEADTRSVVSGNGGTAGILNSIKLPTIELPKFNGDFRHWLEYKDTFSSLIHNNTSISDVQKYHYLKSSLESTASQVIKSIELSEKNYVIAWGTLCDRFDNTKLLIHNHVKALFDIEAIYKESSFKIRQLLDTINKNLRSLEQLEEPVHQWDTLIIYMVMLKLDKSTLREWEKYKVDKEISNLNNFKSFLKSRADLLETLEINNVDKKGPQFQNRSRSFLSNKVSCVVCKKEHYIYSCPEFLNLNTEDRSNKVKELKLCINCLRFGHFLNQCRLPTCKKCNSKHHTLLHIDQEKNIVSTQVNSNQEKNEPDKATITSFTGYGTSNYIFLATAYIHILDSNNKTWTARALLDCGSQSSFITENLFKRLNLKEYKTDLCVTGLNYTSSQIKGYCEVFIQSMHSAFNTSAKLFIIPDIANGLLPNNSIDVKGLNIPPNITLADSSFFKPGKIDILIGADLFWQLICIGQKSLGTNKPVLQKTKLGWVVSGQIDSKVDRSISCNFVRTNDDIQEQLKRFWEIEECVETPLLSKEEINCEKHFVENTERNVSGKFIVSIPFKDSPSKLGESYTQAHRRFLSLERKLQLDSNLKNTYSQFMQEYLSLGHMSKVNKSDKTEFKYYMPHHCVMKNDSLTTKLRVVFDASTPTSSGLSLNHIQMKGPIIQEDLFSIILRFRKYEIVIAADIEKMYRQVLINPEQRSLQRIVWRSDINDELEIFNLNTVTYGTTAASFLAERCIKQLALENETLYPEAANSIKTDFYVDDWLSGAQSVESAKQLCSEVTQILETGGFRLRKFYSNEPKIFENMQNDDSSMAIINFGNNENTKTLGLVWSPYSDELRYKISINNEFKVTKRSMLSIIAQVFDPLGLLSPCIIVGKIIIQILWLEKLSWDESLPQILYTQWMEFKNELPLINNLKIKRKVICQNPIHIELHGFSDASEKAYGACVYVRTVEPGGTVHSHLLCAKSKVAPLKILTIPKLELCAARLLAKLMHKVRILLKHNVDNCILWTDSTIVLHWLKTAPNCLKPFVGNRVSEITDLTDSCIWKYVPSSDNPADVVSRGILPSKIINLDLWWYGPSWITQTEEFWPKIKLKQRDDIPELRSNLKTFLNTKIVENSFPFDKFSNLNRLKRVTAYMFRFKHNCLNKESKLKGILTLQEINNSFENLIKIAQTQAFKRELDCLRENKQLESNSKLKNLNPFLDNGGVMRVGGRINNSNFNYNKMHPIIMPKNHHLLKLIFLFEHERLLHAGPSLLLSVVREKFWPIGGRNMAKKIVHNCVSCFKQNAKVVQPIMGNLPKERVELTVPFNVTGVDYAGPFVLKDRKGRGCKTLKGYISLFICFSIKAIHLELVTDLTKESFLLALKRFVSRRGKPSKMFSDNGTNFVAANNELKNLGQFLIDQSSSLVEACINEGVDWEFIPPHSPHFGGLWEAGVKSVKYHLRRVLGNNVFTYEEFYSIIVQIEGILNSRPLCPLSSEPSDMSPLTPAHFLIGKPLTSLPEEELGNVPENRMSRYQHIQSLRRHFWERWSKEYISELQTRQKWKETKDHLPPLKWNLGRVVCLCPGSDGVNRVAVLRTQSGEIKRSFAKICPLPIIV